MPEDGSPGPTWTSARADAATRPHSLQSGAGRDRAGVPESVNVVLVGLMGAGKSCIGKRLAAKLGRRFVDADAEIEAAAGCTISEIFAEHGEAYFRDGERRVIARLLETPGQVIATGGGAFMNEETRAAIAAGAVSVWLRADLDLLVKRTARRNTRPLLRQGDPREILSRLIDQRYPVYAEADLTVESADGPPEITVERALAALAGYRGQPHGAGDA